MLLAVPLAFAKAEGPPCRGLSADLRFFRAQLEQDSSPFNYDAALRRRTDEVFNALLAQAPQCRTGSDYARAMRTYAASFHDPHLRVYGLPKAQALSAGIRIRRFNDRYFVWDRRDSEVASLRRGDEWRGCEGRSAKDILEGEVLPLHGYSALDAALYAYADEAFSRTDTPRGPRVQCDFERDGKTFNVSLRWSPAPPTGAAADASPIYSSSPQPWGPWVSLRQMGGDGASDLKLMQQFVAQAASLREAKTIVLDLRGNGGGDSNWGDRWIEALYGYAPPKPRQREPSCLLWASPGNLSHFRDLDRRRLGDETVSSAEREWLRDDMAWLSNRRKGFIPCERPAKDEAPAPEKTPSPQFHGRLYVLTDAVCMSSCEMFVMALREMPGVTHIGLATDASTLYGDVRSVRLPSRNARIQFPQKVFQMASLWKGRKPGEPIIPQISLEYDPAAEAQGRDSLREAALRLVGQ